MCRLCSTSPATFHLTRRPLCGQDTSAGKTRGCCPGGRDPLATWSMGGYPPTKLDSLWVLMGDLEGPTTASLPVTNLLPLRHLRLAPVKRCIYIFFGMYITSHNRRASTLAYQHTVPHLPGPKKEGGQVGRQRVESPPPPRHKKGTTAPSPPARPPLETAHEEMGVEGPTLPEGGAGRKE